MEDGMAPEGRKDERDKARWKILPDESQCVPGPWDHTLLERRKA